MSVRRIVTPRQAFDRAMEPLPIDVPTAGRRDRPASFCVHRAGRKFIPTRIVDSAIYRDASPRFEASSSRIRS